MIYILVCKVLFLPPHLSVLVSFCVVFITLLLFFRINLKKGQSSNSKGYDMGFFLPRVFTIEVIFITINSLIPLALHQFDSPILNHPPGPSPASLPLIGVH